MICPKCGQEYEGDKCPRCNGPEVIVNNADYLKRKRAYEEKQAGKGSASSDKETSDKVDSGKGTAGSKKSVQEEVLPDEMFRRLKESGSKFAQDAVEKTASQAKKAVKGKKKLIVRIIAAAIVLMLASLAGFGIFKLATRKNYVLYMKYNNKIYNVAGIDSKLVCSEDDIVFEADNNSFYMPEFSDEIDKNNIIQKMASNQGKYFTAITYDSMEDKYTLFVWNNSMSLRLAESSNKKEILYISDKGTIIYKDTQVVNDQGALGQTSLMVSKLDKSKDGDVHGVITEVESSLANVYIYSAKNTIIYNSTGNVLYTLNYDKDEKKKEISEDAKNIYALTSKSSVRYSYKANPVNQSDKAEGFIYSVNGNCYYHSISSKNTEDMFIGKFNGSGVELIYDRDYVYVINSGQVSYASVKKDVTPVFTVVSKLGGASDYVFLELADTIAAVDENNNLISISSGKVKTIAENITDGSLSIVKNTSSELTYIRDNVQYYKKSLTADEVKMTDVGSDADTVSTLFYKNKLYYYNSDKKLCSCTVKGKNGSVVGDVERFWLGTEYK
jgi:predicted lipoprotein with Yx(FWY)xxD motif